MNKYKIQLFYCHEHCGTPAKTAMNHHLLQCIDDAIKTTTIIFFMLNSNPKPLFMRGQMPGHITKTA